LSLNLEKPNVIKFITKNSPQYPLNIGYNDKHIEGGLNKKFLGLKIYTHLNWGNSISQLIPKLSRPRCAVRFMLQISNTDTLETVHFAYFHSLMKEGIIFGGNSADSKNVFTLTRKLSES
jgi:hypothetical protein